MAKLSQITIPSVEVPLPGLDETITVRGLSVNDLERIFQDHGEGLTELFRDWVASKGLTMPEPAELINMLRQEVPDVLAAMIALANDDPDAAETVSRLPGVVQVSAAIEVLKLTFHSVAELKKILEQAILGMEAVTDLMTAMVEPIGAAAEISGALPTSDGSVSVK